MKRRQFNKTLAATIAAIVSPLPRLRLAHARGGATLVFGYPNGFPGSPSAIHLCNDTTFSGSVIRLINDEGHNSSGVWYATKQPPNAFTTQFTFQPMASSKGPASGGMTFCIQNNMNNPGFGFEYAGDANMCGYGGGTTQNPPVDSIAIKFDLDNDSVGQNYPTGGIPSSTGLYFNGGPSVAAGSLGLCPCNDLNPYGLTFVGGHTYKVTIVYDGTVITMVLLDTTTAKQARFEWTLNLANTTNTSGNFVGFTAGTPVSGSFELLSWSYWSGYNTRLAKPTFSPMPGEYASTQTVTISYPAGSTCYYTTNGLSPTSASTKYAGPITVSASAVIKAVAIESGLTDSFVATGAYQINTANVINFPTGFATGNLITVGCAYLSGQAIRVTDTTNNAAGAAWFPVPVNVSAFSTEFTLKWGSNGQGMCFVMQNDPPLYTSATGNAINWSGGPTAVAAANAALGYGGINDANGPSGLRNGSSGTSYGLLNSVAIVFNQYDGTSPNPPANSVGLCTHGTIAYGMGQPAGTFTKTGLAFSSGNNGTGPSNPLKVTMTYSGTTLSFTMTDTVTAATFTHSFTIDIPKTVGANTAYVGFTGGTGGAASIQSITSWTYTAAQVTTPAVPNAPTNLMVR